MRGLDRTRIRAAIDAAERATSSEIVVSIARPFWGGVERVAWRAFDRLRIGGPDGDGVLIFVAPVRHRIVICSGPAIHALVGQGAWDATVAAICHRLRAGDFTGGLVHGIELVGSHLAAHFPYHRAHGTPGSALVRR